MFKVKRTPVDVVKPTGMAVLNATDPLVVEMKELSAGGVTFFAIDGQHPVIREHRSLGKRVVFVRDSRVIFAEGEAETQLVRLEQLPCTHGGRVGFQIENVLAAAAAGWALGLATEAIRTGLESFQGNLQDDPARFSVLESSEKTIVVMDGRNESALRATIAAIKAFPHAKCVAVYSAEEDRRDSDIIQQGKVLGESCDRVVICEIEKPTTRSDGDLTGLLRGGIEQGTRCRTITEIPDWNQAVDAAWKDLQAGELLMIQTSTIPKTVKKLQTMLGLDLSETST
jgi:cyanophycin synthetase